MACAAMDLDLTRRPPPSLLSLSRRKVVEMSLAAVGRRSARLAWLGWPFNLMDSKAYRRHAIRQLQAFLSSAGPADLFDSIAKDIYRSKPSCTTTEGFLHPLLRTLEVNSTSLAIVLDNAYNLMNLTTLYLFFDINRHGSLVHKLHSFVGSLTKLTHLKVSNCCTDALMAVVGENCKSLQVLDGEEDSEMTLTDHGLAFLTGCKELRAVVLNDTGDEYDYEDRYFGISGKGLANLVLSLPRLQLLVCEPYLLKSALRFVFLVNVSGRRFVLKYLHAKQISNEHLEDITRMCPDIRELVLEDLNKNYAAVLPTMRSLQILRMANCFWPNSFAGGGDQMLESFQQLTHLVLKNPRNLDVSCEFVSLLGAACPNLKSLSLTLYGPDSFERAAQVAPLSSSSGFFPKLEALFLDGDFTLNLVESLLMSLHNLRCLSVLVHLNRDLSPSTSMDFDSLVLRTVRDGRLSNLEELHCFQWKVVYHIVSLETMLFLIDQCSRLRRIYGLDLLMLCPQAAISVLQEHIVRNNRNIDLMDPAPEDFLGADAGVGMSAVSPDHSCRGVPFLCDRSRHLAATGGSIASAASTSHTSWAKEADKMEHLLKEGTLEELLKEVSLL